MLQISLRDSIKDVNPLLINVITQLRNIHKLSYSACLECFVCVSNGFFNQKYKLGQFFITISQAAEKLRLHVFKPKINCFCTSVLSQFNRFVSAKVSIKPDYHYLTITISVLPRKIQRQ